MKVNQIASMLNDIYREVLGQDNLFTEDLSNSVSCGQIITKSSNAWGDNFDNYTGKILDKVGRSIFVDRTYNAKDLGIWRPYWEYASMLEKTRCEVNDFVDNDEWKLLDSASDGPDYNATSIVDKLFGFVGPEVQAKYFNLKTTFRNKISITRKQLKSAFNGASEMARFIAMIENRIRTKLEIGKQELEKRVVTNLGCAAYDAGNYVDLRAQFISEVGKDGITSSTTLAEALKDPDVLRYIAEKMTMTRNLMSEPSKMYSITKSFMNFTPEDLSRLIVLDDLDVGLKFNLYGSTYNEEFVKLNGYTTIPYWQGRKDGSGTDTIAQRANVSAVANVNSSGSIVEKTVTINNLVGILFDRDAAMICNEDPEVRSQYNPDGNFTNFFYNYDCSYYNDFDENAIVFVWGVTPSHTTMVAGSASGKTKVSATILMPGTNGKIYGKMDTEAQDVTLGEEFTTTGYTEITVGTTEFSSATAGKVITFVAVDKDGVAIAVDTVTLTSAMIES